MARYIAGRLLGVFGVLIAVSLITFTLMHAVPGGPFDASAEQQYALPEHIRQDLLRRHSLDRPVYQQYLSYMAGVLHGDLGVSFRYGEPVVAVIRRGWPATLQLGLTTLLVSLAAGLTLGMIAALRPNTRIDYAASALVVSGAVAPSFVVAVLLIAVFSVHLRWLPTGGWGTARQVILPVAAYALAPAATIARFTRSAMLEALRAEHIRTAQAKGVPIGLIVTRHALRNALIPLLTVVGPLVVSMVVGSFFVETIFRIPGIGSQLTTAIYNRDYPLIMGLTLLWSALVSLAYLATDLLYIAIDPRLRVGGGAQ